MNWLKQLARFVNISLKNGEDTESQPVRYRIIERLSGSGAYFELEDNGQFLALKESDLEVRDCNVARNVAHRLIAERLGRKAAKNINFEVVHGSQVGRWSATESLIDLYHRTGGEASLKVDRCEISLLLEAKELTPIEVKRLQSTLTRVQDWISLEDLRPHPSEIALFQKAQNRIATYAGHLKENH